MEDAMKKSLKPGEPPATGDIQPREAAGSAAAVGPERRRRKAVDRELAKDRPIDERVDGLTGKYIA
jgi:hypothetical protein